MEPNPESREAQRLLRNLQERLAEMTALLERAKYREETGFYKFYSGGTKLMLLKFETLAIAKFLKELMPERELHEEFIEIVEEGTGEQRNGRRILEAYLHACTLLALGVKCAAPGVDVLSYEISEAWRAFSALYGIFR